MRRRECRKSRAGKSTFWLLRAYVTAQFPARRGSLSNFAHGRLSALETFVGSSIIERPASQSTYSITSSARANRCGDKVSPIKLAAFALIVNRKKAVTCSTGRSEGFRPLRTLSTTATSCLFSM
jgi:hypothetical protein